MAGYWLPHFLHVTSRKNQGPASQFQYYRKIVRTLEQANLFEGIGGELYEADSIKCTIPNSHLGSDMREFKIALRQNRKIESQT